MRVTFNKTGIVYRLKLLLFVMGTLSFCGISSAQTLSQNKQYIIVKNRLNFTRKEVIAIPRSKLHLIISNEFPIVNNGKNLVQLVDENNDGKWDKLLIEVEVKANSLDTLSLIWSNQKNVAQKKNTNVRFSFKSKTNQPENEIFHLSRKRGFVQDIANPIYQMEGPGIENDKVAFRIFFDERNGKDIYGKIVSDPILEKVGLGASWHQLQDWGMDILHTGNSLGAGALAAKENQKLYRLGDADSTTFTSLHEGPLEAALKLDFYNWDIAKSLGNGSEKITMQKGDYYYKNEVHVPLNANQDLVSGIANFGEFPLRHLVLNDKFSVIYTYGKQAEGTDGELGLAILFPTKDFNGDDTTLNTDEVPNTSYVSLKPNKKNTYCIYFFSCWAQTDNAFKTETGFKDYLKREADQLANPIKIKMINIQ